MGFKGSRVQISPSRPNKTKHFQAKRARKRGDVSPYLSPICAPDPGLRPGKAENLMPKRLPRVRLNESIAHYAFFLALCRLRPACAEDLFSGGGGGHAARAWAARWGLPGWCAELGKRACRQRQRTPRLPLPAWAGFVPEAADPFRFEAPGWDWLGGEQPWTARDRLRGAFEAALEAHFAEREAGLAGAGWAAVPAGAMDWLVRRAVPTAPGGRPETALNIGEDRGVDETTVSRETAALARLLGIELPGGDWRTTKG